MNYGIVSEFNPFHNGHKHLLDSLKSDGESTVTVVISESFVQRGECAIMTPSARAEAALRCGADLVVSLPVPYATAGAERFAEGGISVLAGLGFVDSVAFGSECGDAQALERCADELLSESFSSVLGSYLDKGLSFPDARQKALTELLGARDGELLSQPNNILAVEYIKAVKKNGYDLEFKTVSRKGASHDSRDAFGSICSASALRELMRKGEDFSGFVPEESLEIINREIINGKAPADFSALENAILCKLRGMQPSDYLKLPDISEGLEFRFCEAVLESVTLEEMLEKIKTKRYTHSRLRRIVICAFLGIEKDDVLRKPPYARVLGFNKTGAALLGKAKESASLPVITKASQIKSLGEDCRRVYYLEGLARDVFSLALPEKDKCARLMTDKLIVI